MEICMHVCIRKPYPEVLYVSPIGRDQNKMAIRHCVESNSVARWMTLRALKMEQKMKPHCTTTREEWAPNSKNSKLVKWLNIISHQHTKMITERRTLSVESKRGFFNLESRCLVVEDVIKRYPALLPDALRKLVPSAVKGVARSVPVEVLPSIDEAGAAACRMLTVLGSSIEVARHQYSRALAITLALEMGLRKELRKLRSAVTRGLDC